MSSMFGLKYVNVNIVIVYTMYKALEYVNVNIVIIYTMYKVLEKMSF